MSFFIRDTFNGYMVRARAWQVNETETRITIAMDGKGEYAGSNYGDSTDMSEADVVIRHLSNLKFVPVKWPNNKSEAAQWAVNQLLEKAKKKAGVAA